MTTLQQYINKNPADLRRAQDYSNGMNIQLYYCGLIKFCNDSGIQTVEQLIYNVDIDEITDFPYWSCALDLTRHDKILTNAYEYIRPELKSNVRCAPIGWNRIAAHWLELLDGDTVTEKQALFALFALPVVKNLDEMHPVRVAWEKRLEEIWAECKPTNMHIVREPGKSKHQPPKISRTQAPITYTPDSSKYDISTPLDHLPYQRQDEILAKRERKKAAVYDYEDEQSTNTITYKQ